MAATDAGLARRTALRAAVAGALTPAADRTADLTPDVARETLAQIGQIVIDWAQIDWQLREAICTAAKLSPPAGRLLLHEPSAARKVLLLRRLLELAGVSIATDLVAFAKEVDRLERLRNALFHGLWHTADPAGPPSLRLLREEWPPTEPPPAEARRFDCEVVELDAAACRGFAHATRELCRLAAKVRHDVLVALERSTASRVRGSHRG